MPLPRVSKIERIPVAPEDAPDWKETLGLQDPYGMGPAEPWLRIDQSRFPKPDCLERLHDGQWVDAEEGVWRIHAYLQPDRAIVSQNQTRLLEFRPDGSRRTLWEGPRLVERSGGALWGDNWMFAACALPDGRWVAALPSIDDPERDEQTWVQRLVLFDADNREIASLTAPERTDTAVKKGHSRRFMVRRIHPACDGQVVVLASVEVLAVGVYESELKFIGKTTMPRLGGGVWIDGKEVLVSTSLADQKINWRRLEGIQALWDKRRPAETP